MQLMDSSANNAEQTITLKFSNCDNAGSSLLGFSQQLD